MNVRRGLARVAVLAVPYFAWWAYRGWTSYHNEVAYMILRQQASTAHIENGGEHNLQAERDWFYAAKDAHEMFEQSLVWGLYVPLGAILALALAYWVYRGFSPVPDTGPNK